MRPQQFNGRVHDERRDGFEVPVPPLSRSVTDINAINAQLGGMNTRLNDLDGRTTKALNAVSMAFALAGTPWLVPTERFAVSMDWGTFQGTNALALNAAFPSAPTSRLMAA